MDYKKKTFAKKNVCKKHGVAKREFGDPFSGKDLLLCPICNRIKNEKKEIQREKKEKKQKLFWKKKELVELAKSFDETIEQKKKNISVWDSQRGET